MSNELELKLELGRRYELGGMNSLYTYLGKVDDDYFFGNDKTCIFHKVSKSRLKEFGYKEHIEEPMNETKEEIKLEVGKLYNLKYNQENNPHKLIYIKNENEDKNELGKHVFIDKSGNTCSRSEIEIKGITEHRELIKETFEGWKHKSQVDKSSIEIFKYKCCSNMIYGRYTFEQKPEPEDK